MGTLGQATENTLSQIKGSLVNSVIYYESVTVANTATTVTALLSGGINNDWSIGDTYRFTIQGLTKLCRKMNEKFLFSMGQIGSKYL